jgi:hypothetical protein
MCWSLSPELSSCFPDKRKEKGERKYRDKIKVKESPVASLLVRDTLSLAIVCSLAGLSLLFSCFSAFCGVDAGSQIRAGLPFEFVLAK